MYFYSLYNYTVFKVYNNYNNSICINKKYILMKQVIDIQNATLLVSLVCVEFFLIIYENDKII